MHHPCVTEGRGSMSSIGVSCRSPEKNTELSVKNLEWYRVFIKSKQKTQVLSISFGVKIRVSTQGTRSSGQNVNGYFSSDVEKTNRSGG